MLSNLPGAGVMLVLATVLVSAQSHPSHQMTNGEISATVYLPDAKNGFYTTTRFDWSGAIASLKYKGHDYYGIWFSKITDIYDFGYEGPSKDVISANFTAMVGPAEEFGVLGYNDVPAGGLFVKPGIGVLKRDEMNYNHSRPYAIANGGKWDIKTSRDSVEFTHTLTEPSIDFGYVYTKVIRLMPGKPQMTISHVMKNTGSKPIVTNVYNHNFTTIDKLHTGPDVEITVPWQMTRAAGRGGAGRQGAAPGAPAAPGRQGQPPVDPYAPLAAGQRMGTQCGQPRMQSLAEPARQQTRVLESARRRRVLLRQLHRVWRRGEGQRHPYREHESGRGRAYQGRSAIDAARVLVDPHGRRAGALYRPQHRTGPAIRLDLHL